MNYIELINQFWQKDIEFDFIDKEIALYFYLLKVSNSIGWKNPFGLSNSMTIAKFNWGKTSFDNAKNRLKKAGLIDFKPGDGRGNVYQYEIKVLVKGTQIKPLSDTLSDTLYSQKSETSINIKDKHKKKIGIGLAPTVTKKIKVFNPPDLKEVQEYFLSTIGNTKKQNPWPRDKCINEAGTLHDHYMANGWVQGRGKPIKDWQAACRNWIRNGIKGSFEKKETVFNKSNPEPVIHQQKPVSNHEKISKEIDYLYGRFLEDAVTIISIEPMHYNFLKQNSLVQFSEEETEVIRTKSIDYIKNNSLQNDEQQILRFMKKFAVIEYFKRKKEKNKHYAIQPKIEKSNGANQANTSGE